MMRIYRHERSAFTLVELLVVVAVIGILAALLFPVFACARENGRRASCQNNLRQLGAAFQLYTQDYDERLPAWCRFTGPTTPVLNAQGVAISWDIALQPYIKNAHILMCPSDHWSRPRSIPGLGKQVFRSYSITGNTQSRPLADFHAPANTVLLLETFSMLALSPDEWAADDMFPQLGKDTLEPEWPVIASMPEFRHNQTGNYLFVDTHVKALEGPNPPFPGYRTSADGIALCSDRDPLPQ